MKNILFATDFSEEAYAALFYTSHLFEKKDCKFYITHFYGNEIKISMYAILNEDEYEKLPGLAKKSRELCNEIKHRIQRDIDLPNHEYEIISSRDRMAEELPYIIKEKKIDLVVMGTKGHRGFMANWEKSNTANLIKKSLPCPILIIPKELSYADPRHIAIASDLRKPFKESQIKVLRELSKNFDSEITLLHVGSRHFLEPAQKENLNHLAEMLSENEIDIEYLKEEHEISRAISKHVKNNSIDLLSMVYYRQSPLERMFKEQVIEHIDFHLSFPFLILPEK